MKRSLKKTFRLIFGGALALTVMSCSNLFDQSRIEENSIENVIEARSVNTTDVYYTLTSKPSATTYNSTYNMYTVDGSKIGNDWYFFVQDLSKYAGKTVTIDFQTSIFVRNSGSTKKLEWVVKSADGYKTISSGNYYKGESPWGIVSGSGTYKLDSNSCIYLATYGITTSNVKVTIADTKLKVTTSGSGNNNTNPTPYPDNNNSSESEDNRIELFANNISSGSYTSNIKSGNFKILATSDKNVSIKSEKASLNGKSFKQTISLNGGGAFEKYRAISFTAKAGDKIRVYAKAGAAGRYLALATATGIKSEKEISTEITSYTFTAEETGTHNLFSTKNGINVYYVAVIPGTEEPAPGPNDDPVTPPETEEYPYTDRGFITSDSIKQGEFYTDSQYTVFNEEENNYLFFYDSLNVNTQTLLKYKLNANTVEVDTIEFSADVHGVVFGEHAEFAMYMSNSQVPFGTAVYEKTEGETQTIKFYVERAKVSSGKYLFIKNINPNAYIANMDFSNVKISVKRAENTSDNQDSLSNESFMDCGFVTTDSIKQGNFYTDSKYTKYDEEKNSYAIKYSDVIVTTQTLLQYKIPEGYPDFACVKFSADVIGIIKGEKAEFALFVSGKEEPIGTYVFGEHPGQVETIKFNVESLNLPTNGYFYFKNINENARVSSINISNAKITLSIPSTPNPEGGLTSKTVEVSKIFNTATGIQFDEKTLSYNYSKGLTEDNIVFRSYLGKIFGETSGAVRLRANYIINCMEETTFAWYLNGKKLGVGSFTVQPGKKVNIENSVNVTYTASPSSLLELRIETNPEVVNSVQCENPKMKIFHTK